MYIKGERGRERPRGRRTCLVAGAFYRHTLDRVNTINDFPKKKKTSFPASGTITVAVQWYIPHHHINEASCNNQSDP